MQRNCKYLKKDATAFYTNIYWFGVFVQFFFPSPKNETNNLLKNRKLEKQFRKKLSLEREHVSEIRLKCIVHLQHEINMFNVYRPCSLDL